MCECESGTFMCKSTRMRELGSTYGQEDNTMLTFLEHYHTIRHTRKAFCHQKKEKKIETGGKKQTDK